MIHLFKTYPIPLFTLMGLLAGIGAYLFGHQTLGEQIWLATLLIGGAPIVFQTFRGILQGKFASDIVAMLAIVTALLMGQVFAGAVVVLMQSGGEALETYGLRRAKTSLQNLLSRAPQFAFRKTGNSLEKIEVHQVRVGDQLMVRSGDLIPVDGTILEGSAEIDESALTGEPLARSKVKNDPVFSGTIDLNGAFEMRADKISQESQYQKIVRLVEKAQIEKAPIQRLADRYAIFFTPLTLLMAALGYLITQNPTTILSVLVVATPCPLILATPLAILCGINKSAQSGIIVKGGAPMEQIGSIQAAIFDKTGTITFGTPHLEEVIPLNHETREELLHNTASIEQLSSHSIAKAILSQEKRPLSLPSHFRETPGRGVEADLGQDHFTIGSYSFLEEKLGPSCFHRCEQAIQQSYQREKPLIFIAKNNLCIGILVISDQIRPEVPSLLKKLKTLGVKKFVLLTGDSAKSGALIGRQAGIDTVQSELLPADKAKIVQKLKEEYQSLAMIGDGINDAPALATATVGIAMGAYGSAISAEAADIVLLVDDIGKVAEAVTISQKTLQIAKQSIFIGIGLSFTLMVIACFGLIPPALGAMLQEMIDFAVILNALRVR